MPTHAPGPVGAVVAVDRVDFGSMDDADRLAAALTGLACTACGRAVPAARATVVARRESLAFVLLDCRACASRTLGLMTWDEAGGSRGARFDLERHGEFGPVDEARFDLAPPVDFDDVLSMHTYLAGYEGDLRGLLDDGWSGVQRGFGTG
jgi:hypothetical protein